LGTLKWGPKPFDFLKRYPTHLKQQPAMSESADVRTAVHTGMISYRHLNHLKVQLYGPKDKVKITKGIEITKI